MTRVIVLFAVFLVLNGSALAQRTEITVSLNEQFFDALLDAVYQNAGPLEFSIADAGNDARPADDRSIFSFAERPANACPETVRLLREAGGVRTAVRFRDGKIYAPIAFIGNYNPPLVGCLEFAGYAETNIDLEFDSANQRLIGRANVLNVALNGTGGVGGTMLARLVQSSLDKKINPIEIVRADKLSFAVPLRNSATLKMKAVGVRHEIVNGALNIHVAYEFVK